VEDDRHVVECNHQVPGSRIGVDNRLYSSKQNVVCFIGDCGAYDCSQFERFLKCGDLAVTIQNHEEEILEENNCLPN